MDDQSCVMEALRLAGSIILENGGETYRVEDTVDRLGRALGAVDVQSFSVPSGMFITVSFPDGTSQTKIYRAHGRGTHLKKVDDVNRISRLAAAGSVSPEQALDALRKIHADGPAFHPAWRLFANAASSAGFAAMFGGGWLDLLFAFLSGIFIQLLLDAIDRCGASRVIQSAAGGALCTLLPLLFNHFTGFGLVDAITGGLLMPLVPGLAMTNAVQDAMRGDVLSGVGHGMQAVLTAVLVAGGSVVASRAVWTLLM